VSDERRSTRINGNLPNVWKYEYPDGRTERFSRRFEARIRGFDATAEYVPAAVTMTERRTGRPAPNRSAADQRRVAAILQAEATYTEETLGLDMTDPADGDAQTEFSSDLADEMVCLGADEDVTDAMVLDALASLGLILVPAAGVASRAYLEGLRDQSR
jgi:hypothetical protein